MSHLQGRFYFPIKRSFHFELCNHHGVCTLRASVSQQAFTLKHCPKEISQTPSLCHWGTSRDHLQSSVCIVKHSAIKGLETRELTTSLRQLKSRIGFEPLVGFWFPFFLFNQFSRIIIRPWILCVSPCVKVSNVKSVLPRVDRPVWFDSCSKRTTTRSRVGEECGSCLSVWHGLLTSYIPPMHKHPSQHILQVKGRLLGRLSTISVIHVIRITPINATRLCGTA